MRQTLEMLDLLDRAGACGEDVARKIGAAGPAQVRVEQVRAEAGRTDFVRVLVEGSRGRAAGGAAPTTGIIGQLGGVGARPARIGLVSDGDGAVAALAAALKLAEMARQGDRLAGDVIVATHVCPGAPIRPHEPVPFMASPVPTQVMNAHQVDHAMDAVLAIDTTRGNRLLNRRGIAITPTVKEGYILRVSEDLLNLLGWTSGEPPAVMPLTTQDITPYGNGLYHMNSILQPSTATRSPVVGVAITAASVVPGSATGASQVAEIELAARFAIETAKAFSVGEAAFYDPDEFKRLLALYGPMRHLQTQGSASPTG